MKYQDLTDKIIGKYKVIRNTNEKDKNGRPFYICKCINCGWEGKVMYHTIINSTKDSVCHHKIDYEKDWIGHDVGRYHIISIDHMRLIHNSAGNFKKYYFKALCNKCGFYTIISDQDLKIEMRNYNSSTISKCSHNIDISELPGMNFGKYKILEYVGRNTDNRILVKAICTKCGFIDIYRLSDIKSRQFDLGEICSHKYKWSNKKIDHTKELKSNQDIVGKNIGIYYIKERLEDDIHGHGVYKVKCNKCGWEGQMVLSAILESNNNKVQQCHHYVDYNTYYNGKEIGKYTIIDLSFISETGVPFYNCKCNTCNQETILSLSSIKNSVNFINPSLRCNHPLNIDDIIGTRFGKYKVLGYAGKDDEGNNLFETICIKCGWTGIHPYSYLTKCVKNNYDEICSHSIDWIIPEIGSEYNGMINRCYSRIIPSYKNINVCDEWMGYYGKIRFRDWALANGFKPGLTLDRIDPTKDYSPNNCQWVTFSYNTKFTSTTNIIHIKTGDGVDICDSVAGWESRLGLYCGYYKYYYPLKNFNSRQERLVAITNDIVNKFSFIRNNILHNINKIDICFEVDNDRPIGYDFNENGELVKKE